MIQDRQSGQPRKAGAITLKQLLEIHVATTHEQRKNHAIPNCLGDGFLLKHNSIYRNIRQAALEAGYQYSSERFFDYEVFPLTQLQKILDQKVLPYNDNVKPLEEVEKLLPNYYQWAELPPLKANYLMHESAHGIAHALRLKILGKTAPGNIKQDREHALALLIEESFANATESCSNIFSTTEMHDEFLYKNSYIMEKSKDRSTLREAGKKFGLAATFRLVMLSYLFSNFVKTKEAKDQFKRAIQIALGPEVKKYTSRPDQNLLQRLFQIGFELDPGFAIFTNQFCLRLMGVKTEFFELLGFDFLSYFEKDHRYQMLLITLSEVIAQK